MGLMWDYWWITGGLLEHDVGLLGQYLHIPENDVVLLVDYLKMQLDRTGQLSTYEDSWSAVS